jgi:hypothetical protein
MNPLTGVDPNRVIDLSSRIKALPSAEQISSMGHGDVVDLSRRVERLLFDIDNAKNSRTVGFALRHRMDKGIPPQRPPLLAFDIIEKKKAELEKILQTMDVPKSRYYDYTWLCRNLAIRNSTHPNFTNARALAKELAMYKLQNGCAKSQNSPTSDANKSVTASSNWLTKALEVTNARGNS